MTRYSFSKSTPQTPDIFAGKGVLAGCAAHVAWGFAVLYWRAMDELSPVSILAHRMLWSGVFMLFVLILTQRMDEVKAAIRNKRSLLILTACAAILSVNWGLFLWAVNSGRIVEASLGYFITPLLNVLMGRIFLGERMTRPQGLAILMVLCGVMLGVVTYGRMPWISLALALSFAVYGFMQKTIKVEAAPSLFVETAVLAPFAIGWLYFAHPGEWLGLASQGYGHAFLLMGTALFTALPLLLFSFAARHLTLATVGIIQYLSPSLNFLLAVTVLGEKIMPADMITFPLIWCALIIYTWDALRTMRALRRSVHGHTHSS